MSTFTLTFDDESSDVVQESVALATKLIERGERLVAIGTGLLNAFAAAAPPADLGGAATPTPPAKPRKERAPKVEQLQDGAPDSPPITAPGRPGRAPMHNDEEAAEIADYAREYGTNAAAKHFGLAWKTVAKCIERVPAE